MPAGKYIYTKTLRLLLLIEQLTAEVKGLSLGHIYIYVKTNTN